MVNHRIFLANKMIKFLQIDITIILLKLDKIGIIVYHYIKINK
jgi:hypothetical protein